MCCLIVSKKCLSVGSMRSVLDLMRWSRVIWGKESKLTKRLEWCLVLVATSSRFALSRAEFQHLPTTSSLLAIFEQQFKAKISKKWFPITIYSMMILAGSNEFASK